MDEFRDGLADILEISVADLTPGVELADHSWDSLAIISCVALIDQCFGVVISGTRLSSCRFVADVENLVAQNVPA